MDATKYKRNYFMPPVESLDWTKKEYIDKAATARIIDAWNALADYYANDSICL